MISTHREAVSRELSALAKQKFDEGMALYNAGKFAEAVPLFAESLHINPNDDATANYLKEELRQLWAQADKAAATSFLESWRARAQASGIDVLRRFAKTLRRHEEGLLAYYDYPLSTGPLEGTNNKIRALQRQAYGFRDLEFFKLKLMALHEAKYALVG